MLKVRLQRIGKKKQAHFRVVVLEHTKKPKGSILEQVGTYDPHAKKLNVDAERINYWISVGAQLSPTVNNLLVNHKVIDRPKMFSWKPKKKEAAAEQTTTATTTPAPAA